MSLRLQESWWLLLVVAAVPLAVLGLRWFRAMSRTRRWTCVLLRLLLLGVLAAALAGATLLRQVDRLAVIAVVDVSGSVERLFDPGRDAAGRPLSLSDRIGAFLDAASGRAETAPGVPPRRADDLSAVVAYDSSPLVVGAIESRSPAPFLPAPLPVEPDRQDEGTNTAAALRVAGAMLPPDAAAKIILFTDGNDTAGDAVEAASAIHRSAWNATRSGERGSGGVPARTIPIDVVPLTYTVPHEVSVASLEAPAAAPAESTVQLRVTLTATAPTAGRLEVSREGEPVPIADTRSTGAGREAGGGNGLRLSLQPGSTVVRVPVHLPAGRVHRFEAIFTPDDPRTGDTIAANNRAQAVTLTPGRSSVLIIDGAAAAGDDPAAGTLAATLRAAGLEVTSLAPVAVPNDPLWFQRYDLVVLQNVPADALAEGVSDTLASYTTDQGGGLVMIGGPDSFGAGGWKGTPIEPILPVRLDLPEQLISPAAAVVIVIDCSGSMGFRVGNSRRSKQAIANDGAAVAVKAMDKTDLVGVIIFNNRYEQLIPLGPNSDPDRSAELIRGIMADGGTNLPPALEAAWHELRAVKAGVKHIIVLSDGRSQGTEQLVPLAQNIHSDGIRVSTIAVGDEADVGTMSAIAGAGDGIYYRVIDPNMLPRIFLKAVRVVRSPLVREKPFVPVMLATGSPITQGLGTPPPLNGLVLTQARTDPGVTYAMATPTGEPLLGYWNVGVGRVAAFTSDASRWAAPWLDWPGYARMWLQMVRTIARPQPDRGQELTVDLDGDDLVVRLAASDAEGRPIDNLDVPAVLNGPGGKRVHVRLVQTGAGEYRVRVAAPDPGSYVVSLTPRLDGRALPPVVGGVARSGGAEYRRLSSNEQRVRQIAAAGGGRVLSLDRPAEAAIFSRDGISPAIAREPLWRWLLFAAIALYLLDVASRRVAWDRFFGAEFGAAARRRAAELVRSRGHAATATVQQLRRRDEELARAGEATAGPPKLSSEDARALVQAEAERRRQARAAARRPVDPHASPAQSPQAGPASRPVDGEGEPVTPPDETEHASSLLEAKRRALRRLRGEDEPRI